MPTPGSSPLSRRAVLGSLALLTLPAATRRAALAADEAPPRRIVAIGGGALSSQDNERRLLRYVLSLARTKSPSVCLLPTASGDNPDRIVAWYELMQGLDCRPRHLRLFGPTNLLRDFKAQLLAADVIFVSGGNTLNMLGVWREHGIDAVLRQAWEQGTVLAGESAGMICWFEQGVTDSRPERLSGMKCLGWLAGSACPHYHNSQRRLAYHELMLRGEVTSGYACDDGTALVFEGTTLRRVVSVQATAQAYRVVRDNQQIREERLMAEILPPPE